MKLVRYGERGNEKPGIIDGDILRDLSSHIEDIAGPALDPEEIEKLRRIDVAGLPIVEGQQRLGACVGGIGKFLCVGMNYSDHAAETGSEIPDYPILFFKANSAIGGANDDIVLPRGSRRTDWEVELGVVIGKAAKYVSKENALDHVAGYCIVNDVSERYFQSKLSGQWTKGKSCDTFGPTGPWLVTRDEVPDPQQLDLATYVNGVQMQSGNTSKMIFSVAEIIEHMSGLFTLHPGDVISTGTPPGVGMGKSPPVFLVAGDVVELKIERLGQQRQFVREEA